MLWRGGISRPPLSSYLLALLLFSGLLVQEALYLHVQMRRRVFAAPALLVCPAPWRRGPRHLCWGSRCDRGEGGARRRGRALERGREAWSSFTVGQVFRLPLDSGPLGSGHGPDHGPQFRVVHWHHNRGGGSGRRRCWSGLTDLDELLGGKL